MIRVGLYEFFQVKVLISAALISWIMLIMRIQSQVIIVHHPLFHFLGCPAKNTSPWVILFIVTASSSGLGDYDGSKGGSREVKKAIKLM